ncbi:MAG: DNA polymerase thumb domain-containing protein, partial [Phycisphaerae bacterium]
MNDAPKPLWLHVDVDAFFASVEQLLIPALRNRPVIVGSGVIASCSYEARRFGLHAGMPLHKAKKLCPRAVVLSGSYPIYRCFAEHVWDLCRRFTTSLETFLDEAYGEATGLERLYGKPDELGRRLQKTVAEEVRLPVSVGLAANRMLAKLASHLAKPRGVRWVPPGTEADFLAPMEVDKLPGVGPESARKLHDVNIRRIGDLRRLSRTELRTMFGVRGELLHDRCRGEDPRPNQRPAIPRTLSRETTFHRPQTDPAQIRGMLWYLLERAMRSARAANLRVGRLDLSIRYEDWTSATAGRAPDEPTESDEEAFELVSGMLDRLHRRRVALRHVGVVLSRLTRKSAGRLFEPPTAPTRRKLHRAVDAIRNRYGHAAVVRGKSIALL